MSHLIILAHPSSDSYNASICRAIADRLREQNQSVIIRDLYQLGFDPVLTGKEIDGFYGQQYAADVRVEQEYIRQAEVLYFVFPTWWYSMPAILKGYIDRVFASGFAFRYSKEGPVGLLAGKKGMVFQTAADPEQALEERGLAEAMQSAIDVGILTYCGIEVVERKLMPGIHHVTDEERRRYLMDIQQSVDKLLLGMGV